jgi:hypothetical protein
VNNKSDILFCDVSSDIRYDGWYVMVLLIRYMKPTVLFDHIAVLNLYYQS